MAGCSPSLNTKFLKEVKMMKKMSTTLRELFKTDKLVTAIWVGTAHQAQLAEKTGFKAVGLSGANVSMQILGLPDAGFMTLTELVENAERVCQSVNIPVIVDCDTGFGNALNVRRTVQSIIRAGAAGLFIEDQLAPKRCGHVKGKELIPLEEAVGKYRAALDVRNEMDPDFIIMARTDGRGAVGGSLEEAIRRGRAYLEAGVDILYVEALQSLDEIKEVRKSIGDSLLMVTTQHVQMPRTEQGLLELGLCMSGFQLAQVESVAMYDILMEYKKRGMAAISDFRRKTADHPMGGFGTFDLAGFPKVVEWEKKYLPAEKLEAYEESIGVYDPRVGHKGRSEA
jgi:2-methylisocitrate lyase-like PEP mutase family enzyme